MAELDLKVCPFCAELIKSAAVVCRYCGRDLPPAGSRPAPADTSDEGPSIDAAPDGDDAPQAPAPQPWATSQAPPAAQGQQGKTPPAKGMESWKAILVGVIVAVVAFLYLAMKGD